MCQSLIPILRNLRLSPGASGLAEPSAENAALGLPMATEFERLGGGGWTRTTPATDNSKPTALESRLLIPANRDPSRQRLRLRVELDSLRQVNLATPIEGIGLTPHIEFPRIRAGFTTSAGLLFAAEGAADFRA